MSFNQSLKRGTIEVLILALLSEEDKYGYQLAQEMEERSEGRYTILETSMYPILYRMLEKKLISDRTVLVGERRRRVYYHIEEAGRAYLRSLRREYLSLTRGVLSILQIGSLEEMECCDNERENSVQEILPSREEGVSASFALPAGV